MDRSIDASAFVVTSSYVLSIELIKTNSFKRIFMPVSTKESIDSDGNYLKALDVARSLSGYLDQHSTLLFLVLEPFEELTEEQQNKIAMCRFEAILRLPLNARDFAKTLEISRDVVSASDATTLTSTSMSASSRF